MNITLTACDKDSSAGYVKSLEFKNQQDFLNQYNQFKNEVPFSRWYVETESENPETEQLIESWLEE
jgi:hypothetical protein